MGVITREVQKIWKEDFRSTKTHSVLIIQKKRLPVKLVYVEEFSRIDEAFYREKQVQGWGHKKKKALIEKDVDNLHKYAECKNKSHYKKRLK